jgi:hypothetical protein
MRKNKTKEQFWYVLGSINVITMAYPIGTYLRANSMEDQILAVSVLVGAVLLLAIVDTVSIAVSYSD